VTISAEVKREIQTLLGISQSKITAVWHGLDASDWNHAPTPEDDARIRALGIDGPFFMYVGQADWRKNHRGMFEGLARAGSRVEGVQLVWAGGLHPRQLAQIHADRRRTGARVRLTGFVDDATLHALYRRALGTIFVSRAEGFGYPVLEAMAMGCPVITSAQSSMKEISGDAALLVDPENHDAIADAIVALATRPELRGELRERGLRHAATFTLERQADETLAVYRRVAHSTVDSPQNDGS
jgi:glycosyltransferase involved in cell wall biosynthesis